MRERLPALLEMDDEALAALPGVSANRTHQIVAGALVAEAVLDVFDLPALEICPWALREGVILDRLDDIKAEDTVTIDLNGKSSIADALVVTSGRSHRHVASIADRVVEGLEKAGLSNVQVEGMPNCDWVVIDAGDVIVHIFRPESAASTTSRRCGAPTGRTIGSRSDAPRPAACAGRSSRSAA